MLEAACAQLAAWRAAGLALPALAVNVSPPRFLHADVVAHLQELLARHGLEAAAITLEVTERLMLDETQDRRAVAQLQQLREMGVDVSIDDFGTGYSSLSYLRRLPISELKIDRSFVNNLVDNADDQALTGALVAMAKALKLRLVAEGVETAAQAALLHQLGCEAAQGYWFARPLAGDAFVAWCAARLTGPKPAPAAARAADTAGLASRSSSMSFRILGLSPQAFEPLFGASDAELTQRGVTRLRVSEPHRAPDRT